MKLTYALVPLLLLMLIFKIAVITVCLLHRHYSLLTLSLSLLDPFSVATAPRVFLARRLRPRLTIVIRHLQQQLQLHSLKSCLFPIQLCLNFRLLQVRPLLLRVPRPRLLLIYLHLSQVCSTTLLYALGVLAGPITVSREGSLHSSTSPGKNVEIILTKFRVLSSKAFSTTVKPLNLFKNISRYSSVNLRPASVLGVSRVMVGVSKAPRPLGAVRGRTLPLPRVPYRLQSFRRLSHPLLPLYPRTLPRLQLHPFHLHPFQRLAFHVLELLALFTAGLRVELLRCSFRNNSS